MDLNSFIHLAVQSKKSRVVCAQTINPESSRGSGDHVSNNKMGVLVPFASVQVAIDRRVRIFPDLKKSLGRMLIVGQWEIVIIECLPGILGIKGEWVSLGEEDVRLERIFVEAVDTSTNLPIVSHDIIHIN